MDASAEIKELLEKYLADRMTPAELERFKVLLGQENGLEDRIEEILMQNRFEDTSGLDRDEIFSKIVRPSPIYSFPYRRWAAAAVILVMLGTGFYFRSQHRGTVVQQDVNPGTDKAVLTLADGSRITLDSNGVRVIKQGNTVVQQKGGALAYSGGGTVMSYNTLSTPRGGQFKVVLPDGTTVWLNAASSLKYPTAFTGSDRNVAVTGEAYFDVARNDRQPFHVKLNEQTTIEVLGTQFNVNNYQDEINVKTTLIDGAVNILKNSYKVRLQPGQQAQTTTDASQQITVVDNTDTEQVTAWKNGLFYFHHASVEEVMHQISRWYDIEVIYEGKIPAVTFDGKMDRNLKLAQIIRILTYMKLNFRMEDGKKLVVMP